MANFMPSIHGPLNESPQQQHYHQQHKNNSDSEGVDIKPAADDHKSSIDGFHSTDEMLVNLKQVDNQTVPHEIEPVPVSISPLSVGESTLPSLADLAWRGSSVVTGQHSAAGSKRTSNPSTHEFLNSALSTSVQHFPGMGPAPVNRDTGGSSSNKRPRMTLTSDTSLHYACTNPHMNEKLISDLVATNPEVASTPVVIQVTKKMYNPRTFRIEEKQVISPYMYPLNIAIENKASSEVLQILIEAAPQVITMWDGPNKETSLHLMLRRSVNSLDLVDILLLKLPDVASAINSKYETPLHLACRYCANLDVIRHLMILYPEALTQVDFNNQTPLQVAQRASSLNDEVLNYLQNQELRALANHV